MARIGAFCFPATGHLYPMTALAHALQSRGHQVVLFGIADTEARVRAAGIEFHCIGAGDFPPGTLTRLDERMARLKGLPALRFSLQRVRNSARMVLRDGPRAVQASGVEALLVDEADFSGNVADYLRLPWISIALLPPMVDDDRFPLKPGEVPVDRSIRFRTLGCYPLTGAVESEATTLPEIIQEMLLTTTSERQGRAIDRDAGDASMEKKKQEGYF